MNWNPSTNPVHRAIAIGDAVALARHHFRWLSHGVDFAARVAALHNVPIGVERDAAQAELLQQIRNEAFALQLEYCQPVFSAAFPNDMPSTVTMLEGLRACLSLHFRALPSMRETYERQAQGVYQCLSYLVPTLPLVPYICEPNVMPAGWESIERAYQCDGNAVQHYATTRRGLLLADGCSSLEIHGRARVFESVYPCCLLSQGTDSLSPFPYTTSDLVGMAAEAHRTARDIGQDTAVTATIPPERAVVGSGRGGRRPLSESEKLTDVAKLKIYEQVRSQKRTYPKWGALSLLRHFKADNAFKLLVVQAKLQFGKKLFATALVWVKTNPTAQETQRANSKSVSSRN